MVQSVMRKQKFESLTCFVLCTCVSLCWMVWRSFFRTKTGFILGPSASESDSSEYSELSSSELSSLPSSSLLSTSSSSCTLFMAFSLSRCLRNRKASSSTSASSASLSDSESAGSRVLACSNSLRASSIRLFVSFSSSSSSLSSINSAYETRKNVTKLQNINWVAN